MNHSSNVTPTRNQLLDRSDTRVTHAAGLSGYIRKFIDQIKSGDLGSLPVVVGLILIWGSLPSSIRYFYRPITSLIYFSTVRRSELSPLVLFAF